MQSDTASLIKPKSLLVGLAVKWRVIIALVGREMVTSYGNRKLGYIWALLEPTAFIIIFLIIRVYIRDKLPFGESALLFMMTGIVTFRLFIALGSRTLSAITANQGLLTYPQVRPMDAIFARIVMQSLTMIVIMVLFYIGISILEDVRIIVHPGRFTLGVILTLYVGAGVGSLNAVVASILPSWTAIWSMLSLPLLIMSGIFYVPIELPPAAQSVLFWNPVIHCVEIVRSSSYLSYHTFAEFNYPIAFATICLTLCLAIERLFRNIILSGT
ncbi:MAG: ABC transporter permease [Pseudomonadota bacterium]